MRTASPYPGPQNRQAGTAAAAWLADRGQLGSHPDSATPTDAPCLWAEGGPGFPKQGPAGSASCKGGTGLSDYRSPFRLWLPMTDTGRVRLGFRARLLTFPPARLISAPSMASWAHWSPKDASGKVEGCVTAFSLSFNPEFLSSKDSPERGRGLPGFCSPAHHVSLPSIHDTFLKLCPPGKHYKEATLTMDQVSSLPALRVSPGWWGGWGWCHRHLRRGCKRWSQCPHAWSEWCGGRGWSVPEPPRAPRAPAGCACLSRQHPPLPTF